MLYGPCEVFKQTGCELSFIILCLTFGVLSPPCRYAGYDPAKPSSKPVVSYCLLNLCLTFGVISPPCRYAGSIEDGTCENYFQQPFTQW